MIGSRRPRGDVEQLHQPFFFELPEPLVELLEARVLQPDAPEVFRRKARDIEKPQRRAGVQGVADGELSGVDEAENVARIGDADGLAIAAEEAVGARRAQRLSHPALNRIMSFSNRPEQTRTNATRSRWRGSMFAWILKTKPVNRSSVGLTMPESRQSRLRRWRELDERLEERLEAEVRQRAAEEHRRLPSGAILRDIEGGAGDADHVQRLAEMRVRALADHRAALPGRPARTCPAAPDTVPATRARTASASAAACRRRRETSRRCRPAS